MTVIRWQGYRHRKFKARTVAILFAVLSVSVVSEARSVPERAVHCRGSATYDGRYVPSKHGVERDIYVTGTSCRFARKLIEAVNDSSKVTSVKARRDGAHDVRFVVGAREKWRCVASLEVDGGAYPLSGIEKIDPDQVRVVTVALSCRPTSRGVNRRVQVRSNNLRSKLAPKT